MKQNQKQKTKEYNLPRLDKMQYGLVMLCNEFLSDIPEESKKHKLKRIRMIALHLSKTDKQIKELTKSFLIKLYGIENKEEIHDKVDGRITVHMDVFDGYVYDLLKHLIEIGKLEGLSGVNG